MEKQRLAGVVLVGSFAILILGSIIFSVPGLYQTENIDERMALIESHKINFAGNQISTVILFVGVAVGYLLFAQDLKGGETAGLANLGATVIVISAIALTIYDIQSIINPRMVMDPIGRKGTIYNLLFETAKWGLIVGQLFFGIVFQRGAFPKWLAYFTLGYTIVIAAVALFVLPFAAELILLVPLVVGFALMRRKKDM